jgi:hypothetical protein
MNEHNKTWHDIKYKSGRPEKTYDMKELRSKRQEMLQNKLEKFIKQRLKQEQLSAKIKTINKSWQSRRI